MSDAEALRRRGHAAKKRVQFTPSECEGHPDGPVMGETFYCDGSCEPAVVEGKDYEKNY